MTLGGGLVIGLSAWLLAPVIGVGLGTAFSTIGFIGASTFLAGSAGATVITTGGCTRSLSRNIPPTPLLVLLPNRGTHDTHEASDIVDHENTKLCLGNEGNDEGGVDVESDAEGWVD
ncbi:hypothetical protein EV368DRAFT_87363 [Lentinula lateritia]|nr:hypothetical protein EV368DRAFT_87363 [Lentinula lateritia]